MNYPTISQRLSGLLGLATPPIGMAFVDRAPLGIKRITEPVPSACTFWRLAEASPFYAPAKAHLNCAVGALTMGVALDKKHMKQLGETVQTMFDANYLAEDEPPNLPTITKPAKGIVYGPLGELPCDPDLVLLWLVPRQAMIFSEAAGTVRWTSGAGKVFGRPACSALAIAMESGEPAISLGCMGMRTFTEVSEDRILAVLPASRLEAFGDELESNVEANESMRRFYEHHKAQFVPE